MRIFVLLAALFVFTFTRVASACNDIPTDLKSLLNPGHLLLFGESHGTKQYPKKISDVVCYLSENGRVVNIGLELPSDISDELNRFITNKDISEKTVLKHPIWHQKFQDGRTSQAMLRLIQDMKVLNQRKNNISLFSFDEWNFKPSERDKSMARNVYDNFNYQAVNIVLVGNLHSSRSNHANAQSSLIDFLSDRLKITSVLFRSQGGYSWYCRPECGRWPSKGKPKKIVVEFYQDSEINHHDWVWNIGPTESSAPAVVN
ncbi:MAG: hypothetical protein V2I33_07220 [Kangiellaceae bacterium]|jgi:hypothetical protein|nr:hypothetical protein [Kangiellaceae bacterium]